MHHGYIYILTLVYHIFNKHNFLTIQLLQKWVLILFKALKEDIVVSFLSKN